VVSKDLREVLPGFCERHDYAADGHWFTFFIVHRDDAAAGRLLIQLEVITEEVRSMFNAIGIKRRRCPSLDRDKVCLLEAHPESHLPARILNG